MTLLSDAPTFDSIFDSYVASRTEDRERDDRLHGPCIPAKPGFRDKDGYAKFGRWRAHRYAWFIANGPIPPGMNVCHKCDNRECINPDHLFLGTQTDNHRDMEAKGRQSRGEKHRQALLPNRPRGENNSSHKLSWAIAREIRLRYEHGDPIRWLGRHFGVSQRTAQAIIRGNTWVE